MAIYDLKAVSEDSLNLKEMMEGILDKVQTVFQSYNVELPGRCYWTMGQPAVDCEQLVVAFVQMYLGAPGAQIGEPQRCNVPRSATVNISISRTTPIVSSNGRPPTPDKIELASSVQAIDSWILMQSINSLDQWMTLVMELELLQPLTLGLLKVVFKLQP